MPQTEGLICKPCHGQRCGVWPSCGNSAKLDKQKTFRSSTSRLLFANLCRWSNYLELLHSSRPHRRRYTSPSHKMTEPVSSLGYGDGYPVPSASAGLGRNVIRDLTSMCCQKEEQHRIAELAGWDLQQSSSPSVQPLQGWLRAFSRWLLNIDRLGVLTTSPVRVV